MLQRRLTYGERSGQPPHRSFFRASLARRARPVPQGKDAVHEHLIDQANLRGYRGAYSARSALGQLDETLSLEEIVVGLLQPHAPAEARILKLVLRILQSAPLDLDRLLLLARRERATSVLTWLLARVPASEANEPIRQLADRLRSRPPRWRPPVMRFDPQRLVRRR